MILGISGKKRVGKDTFYFMAKDMLTVPYYRLSFADGVKEQCAQATGWTITAMEQHKEVFRNLYQWWGTEFRRRLCDTDYWIKYLANRLTVMALTDEPIVFITDVRFRNEADWIKSQSGILIRIERFNGDGDMHQSETDLDSYHYKKGGNGFDHYVHNTGTMTQFREKVYDTLTRFIDCKLEPRHKIFPESYEMKNKQQLTSE